MNVFMSRALVCAAIVVLSQSRAAIGVELITNGGFETGDFSGWTVTDQTGSFMPGSFYVLSAGVTPNSGNSTVGPASGVYYAVSDQDGAGTHVIEQTFTVPGPAASVILSFDQFVNDSDNGPIIDPAGLDYTADPNQHARVDLMTAGASPFDTGGGVLANFYIGVDPQSMNPNPYTPYLFDITGLVGGGGTYKIRFAEVDNQFYLNQGVDNVSIDFTPVPEPSTCVLAVLACGGISLRRRMQ